MKSRSNITLSKPNKQVSSEVTMRRFRILDDDEQAHQDAPRSESESTEINRNASVWSKLDPRRYKTKEYWLEPTPSDKFAAEVEPKQKHEARFVFRRPTKEEIAEALAEDPPTELIETWELCKKMEKYGLKYVNVADPNSKDLVNKGLDRATEEILAKRAENKTSLCRTIKTFFQNLI